MEICEGKTKQVVDIIYYMGGPHPATHPAVCNWRGLYISLCGFIKFKVGWLPISECQRIYSGSWISSIVSYISSSRYKAELPYNIKLPVMMKKYGLSFMDIDVVINSRIC